MSYQLKNFTELDFDNIKASLKEYLSTQEAFVGFDFEGTAINTLVNLLAYNTQYNAFYLNMHASERFLSTAQRRENVVALAKNLGYVPYASKGAEATLSLSASPKDTVSKVNIPKHSIVKASTEDSTFTFYTKDSYDLTTLVEIPPTTPGNPPTRFYTGNVQVFEGKKFSQNFVFTDSDPGITLPNNNVQTDKLVVVVVNGSTEEYWSEAESTTSLNSSSKVYFIEEVVGAKTRIYFGDNIIGKKPSNGTTVKVTYFTSSGSEANGSSDFTFSDISPDATEVLVSNPTTKSYGAVDIESMDSIRANAPLAFETQGRAVTAQDFKNILYKLVPAAHTVAVWGGEEEVNEPRLGYVFLSWVTEEELQTLSQGVVISRSVTEKTYVQDQLRTNYATVTIFPEVKDPQFVFLKVSAQVFYDSSKSTTATEISNLVKANISNYYEQNVSRFQTTLRYSKLSAAIDNSSQYVTSNDLTVYVYQEKTSAASASTGVSIGVPVKPNTMRSSYFGYSIPTIQSYENAFFTDRVTEAGTQTNEVYLWNKDSQGTETPCQYIDGSYVIVGTINRETGTVTFADPIVFDITTATGITSTSRLVVSAEPKYKDVDFGRNLLAVLRVADVSVDVLAD